MKIRMGTEEDYQQLAEMKWLHCEEDDIDYQENNLEGADKERFTLEFAVFLAEHPEYRIYVACEGETVASAMFVYVIPKAPKPNREPKYIAYLTNVYTRREYRNQGIGTLLLQYVKDDLAKDRCEMLFAWPSANSVNWYTRNDFNPDNEMMQCGL